MKLTFTDFSCFFVFLYIQLQVFMFVETQTWGAQTWGRHKHEGDTNMGETRTWGTQKSCIIYQTSKERLKTPKTHEKGSENEHLYITIEDNILMKETRSNS